MKAIPKPFNEIDWSIGGGQFLSIALLVAVCVNGLWLMDASITPGIHVHFLGLVTFLVVYRPKWLYDYSDNTYF